MSGLVQPIGSKDHTRGRLDAPALLVEYGDYECPYCGRAFPIVEEVLARLGDEICFTFRHFPLSQMHPHALGAAQAAEAAGAQDQFWEMHRTLFENQEALEIDNLLIDAESLGLELSRFAEDLRNGAHLGKISGDFRSGVRSGVNGTPTFFINGNRFDESWAVDTLTAALIVAARAPRAEQRMRG